MTAKMIDKLALITLKDGKVAMVRSHNKTLFYARAANVKPVKLTNRHCAAKLTKN